MYHGFSFLRYGEIFISVLDLLPNNGGWRKRMWLGVKQNVKTEMKIVEAGGWVD